MKLRNKKTGNVFNVAFNASYNLRKIAFGIEEDPDPKNPKYNFCDYESLEEFCKNWEDVKEPLIKDDKIIKLVREWANVFGTTKVHVTGIGDGREYLVLYAKKDGAIDGRIRLSIPVQDLCIGKEYTIAELCGEE